jgi:hypothetical protein
MGATKQAELRAISGFLSRLIRSNLVFISGLLDFKRPQSRVLGIAALIFLWLLSLYQDKESDMDFRQAKEPERRWYTAS